MKPIVLSVVWCLAHGLQVSTRGMAPRLDQVVVDGALDLVEDSLTHLRRLRRRQQHMSPPASREKLVVLGSGWGAHALLKVIDVEKYKVTVISPTNHFVFTPMLAGASVGTVEFGSITETVARSNPLVEYVAAEATDVDMEQRLVATTEGDVAFDVLVIATGVRVNDAMAPGAERCHKLKTTEDAAGLRRAVAESFEKAARTTNDSAERERHSTFAVVGGGPSGVELAGELSDLVADATQRHYTDLEPTIVLVEAGPDLLPYFEQPQRDVAKTTLERAGVQVKLSTIVAEVRDEKLILTDRTDTPHAYDLPYSVAVWCAGTAPTPFLETLLDKLPASAQAPRQLLAVDNWLRLDLGHDHSAFGRVFALGDCARLNRESLPQTAQVASQQGAYLARVLNRRYDSTRTPPALPPEHSDVWTARIRNARIAPEFSFLNLGIMAYLGSNKALAQVQLGDDLNLGAYAGSPAYLLWKSVYLVKQVATRNRILVLFDWFKAAVFGRDLARF